jgi:hypothetical protein
MFQILTISFLFFCLSCTGIKYSTANKFNGLSQLDFCDLPLYENQLVYVKAVYSGVDEYWGLNSLHKCKNALTVELDDREGAQIPKQYQKLFDSAYSNYWNTYLIIELTGTFESKNPKGYGHLGSNKSRLIVKDYVDITLVKK